MLITYLGKYRVIALSIALFLLFDLGVLVLNFIISSQIAADAVSVNLAGRQRMLSQRTVKSLLQLQEAVRNSEDPQSYLGELQQTFNLFDRTLVAFTDGGSATGGDGKPVMLNQIDRASGKKLLEDAYLIWTPYRERINAVLASGGRDPARLAEAIQFASLNNIKLLALMNSLTSQVEAAASDKADTLRAVQIGGISLATMNFLVILFHFIRQLRQNDRALELARKESEQILDTMGEGMFLLDKNYCIGSRHSRALGAMFKRDHLEGAEFFELLRPLVPDKTLLTAQDYIALLFGNRVNEKLVRSVNPLDRVEVNFADGKGGFERRFLSFDFSRVLLDAELSHLLVTVNDVTDRVLLEQELERSQQETQAQMDMMLEVIHLDPNTLGEFLGAATATFDEINAALEQNSTRREELTLTLQAIARSMHRFKGEAAALGLRIFARRAHEFEDAIAVLRQKPQLEGEDFLPLAVLLKELYSLHAAIRELLSKLADLRVALGSSDVAVEGAPECKDMERLAQKIAERQRKMVLLQHDGVCDPTLPTLYRQSLQLIATQLVRNAIVHGIEPPERRRQLMKPAVGTLSMEVRRDADGGYDFLFRDDGGGVSLDRVREQAVASGWISAEQAQSLVPRELLRLLFQPEFSTAARVDEDAGRGVGLDVVTDLVRKIGGRLSLRTAKDRYCEFVIHFPPMSQNWSSAA